MSKLTRTVLENIENLIGRSNLEKVEEAVTKANRIKRSILLSKIPLVAVASIGIYLLGVLYQMNYTSQRMENVPIEQKYNSAKSYINHWKKDKNILKLHPLKVGNYLASDIIYRGNKDKFENKE